MKFQINVFYYLIFYRKNCLNYMIITAYFSNEILFIFYDNFNFLRKLFINIKNFLNNYWFILVLKINEKLTIFFQN